MTDRAALLAELLRLTSWRREYEAFDPDVDTRIRQIQDQLAAIPTVEEVAA